jgi:hypothetical protein
MASAAMGLKPVRSMSPAQYSSWLPMTTGQFSDRMMLRHSTGFGP